MFKLLLCAAVFAPCCVMPFIGMGSSEIEGYELNSFDQAYVQPKLERLQNCESVDLGVFFHDAYIEAHSADYISEGVKFASACDSVTYSIQPLISESASPTERLASQSRTEELLRLLKAHGVDANVDVTQTLEEAGALFLNGQTAVLKIITNDRGNA